MALSTGVCTDMNNLLSQATCMSYDVLHTQNILCIKSAECIPHAYPIHTCIWPMNFSMNATVPNFK